MFNSEATEHLLIPATVEPVVISHLEHIEQMPAKGQMGSTSRSASTYTP